MRWSPLTGGRSGTASPIGPLQPRFLQRSLPVARGSRVSSGRGGEPADPGSHARQRSRPLRVHPRHRRRHVAALPRLADELGIGPSGSREGRGAAGRVQVSMARVDSLAIGGARSGPMPVGIAADVDRIGAAVGHRIDGDIGYDFLKAFRLTLDYRRRVIRLAQGDYEVAGAGGASHAEFRFRLAGPIKPLVLVPAFVNGRGPHAFVLDTGASATVLSAELAASLRIETVAAGPMTGAGGLVQAALGRVGSLVVGSAALEDVVVMVADFLAELGQVVGARLDGVLGYNFLRHFRVTLDYPGSTLWLMKMA
ncbi:MAG: aspartyl protease family protein [Candidatus Eiseniibacteriota bacterium]